MRKDGRRANRLGLLVWLGLGLSACSTGPLLRDDASPATPQPPMPAPIEIPSQPLPKMDTALDLLPENLLGVTPEKLVQLMGAPSLVRRDGDVQTHLYENTSCVLDFTLMSPAIGAGFSVRHLAARDRLGRVVRRQDCLASFLAFDALTAVQKDLLFARPVPDDTSDEPITNKPPSAMQGKSPPDDQS